MKSSTTLLLSDFSLWITTLTTNPHDLAACHDLAQSCFPTQDIVFDPSKRPAHEIVWIAHRSGEAGRNETSELVGFLIGAVVVDELSIQYTATATAWRQRGIGKALLTRASYDAKAQGARVAWLEVRRSNEAALALYRRFGFTVARIRPRYYVDNDEDAIEMTCRLP